MNVVMIIPTGIGCEIGGHAGDATPSARLLSSVCDKLILHPNVVNASDINEMPENSLYVEGSILDRFLEGKIELQEVKKNKILVVVNKPILNETINAVSAARATLGIDVTMLELKTPLRMTGYFDSVGKAVGDVVGWKALVEQVSKYEFDALAIATLIDVEPEFQTSYFQSNGKMVNPWGGVEAIASKAIANELNKPVAHAPIEGTNQEIQRTIFHTLCDPRMAAESISNCYLYCVLKGLHKAPRIGKGLSVNDVDVMVSPKCWERPHDACKKAGIPIIVVSENTTVCEYPYGVHYPNIIIWAKNYLEAAGIVAAMEAGISLDSVRRPLKYTEIEQDG